MPVTWGRNRNEPPPVPPPARKVFAYPSAPWYSSVGPGGPLPEGEFCALVSASFVVIGTDNLIDVFANGSVTAQLQFTDSPPDIRVRLAEAIRKQLQDAELTVVFVTGSMA